MADWDQFREGGQQVSPPAFESLVREAARRDRRARALTAAATLAVIGAVVGVVGLGVVRAGDDDGAFQPAEAPVPSVTERTDDAAGVLPLPAPDEGKTYATLTAGRYRVPLSDTLAFDVDLPEGTSVHEDGLYIATGTVILKTEAADDSYGVPYDPCSDQFVDPAGPTVDDLVEAIGSEPIYQTTPPEPAELGGAEGSYLEVRIPADYDASQCADEDVATPGSPSSIISWEPGYRGRYWILDVNGERVVIQHHCAHCSDQRLDQTATIPASITFVSTD